jgi:hypothetical protein
MFFIVPCSVVFNYNKRQCNRYGCIVLISKIALIDSIGDYILPTFSIAIFSVALFVRVVYKRYRIRGRIDWRNYQKMAVQLLPISALYIVLQLPVMILYAAYSGGLSRTIAADYYADGLFFSDWIILLTPFASAISLPDLKTKCRNAFLFWRRRRVVGPEILMLTRSRVRRTPVAVLTIG